MSARHRHTLRLGAALRLVASAIGRPPLTTRVAFSSGDFCRHPSARTARPGSATLG